MKFSKFPRCTPPSPSFVAKVRARRSVRPSVIHKHSWEIQFSAVKKKTIFQSWKVCRERATDRDRADGNTFNISCRVLELDDSRSRAKRQTQTTLAIPRFVFYPGRRWKRDNLTISELRREIRNQDYRGERLRLIRLSLSSFSSFFALISLRLSPAT